MENKMETPPKYEVDFDLNWVSAEDPSIVYSVFIMEPVHILICIWDHLLQLNYITCTFNLG